MSCRSLVSVAGIIAIAGSVALAFQPAGDKPAKPSQPSQPSSSQPSQPTQPLGKQPDHALPPGMTPEDMKACEAAATPGPQHAKLAEIAGTWAGKTKMWMTPDQSEPVESTCTTIITPVLDGRYVRIETKGEMPGMGMFEGFGINGYDNVTQKYQTTWIDNCGTSIATGTGDVSADGKTYTWKLSYSCPINKKPATLREVEKRVSKDAFTLEMFGNEPHSGKEFKMMEIAYTRTGPAPAAKPTTPTR